MALKKTHAVALCAVFLAVGCSSVDDALFPSLNADAPASAAAAGRVDVSSPPMLGTSSFEPVAVTPGAPTGTFVGQKVTSLRGDLQQMLATIQRENAELQNIRNSTAADSQRYHGTVAAINTRLQVGTTPGNPILTGQWNSAQGELDKINDDVAKMNRLATDVASSSAMASYLLDSVRAARTLSGAVDEDHRQLRILEDETNRTVVLIERLLTELSGDVNRQQQYVANEKSNLNTLAVAIKNGQMYGTSLATRNAAPQFAPAVAPQDFAAPTAAVAGGRPLVVIRFDRPNVNYENALYTAVKGALDRKPTASFEVVAVSPSTGAPGQAALASTTARRNAESVVRSLTNMGLPTSRISLSAVSSDVPTGEVHVFVR